MADNSEVFPKTGWQHCTVHFYRNVFSHTPNNKVGEVARMLKAMKLSAADLVEQKAVDC